MLNKKKYKSANDILSNKIDIKAGKISFSQRIELGRILESDSCAAAKFSDTFFCLFSYKPNVLEYKSLLGYFQEITEGVKYWIDQEALLKYEPTSEEMQAGITNLSKKIGEFGIIKALAKAYSKDPDDILAWEYGKVFGILYTDMEEHKYQRSYNKVIERKYKK